MLKFFRRLMGERKRVGEKFVGETDFKALAENSLDTIIRCDANQITSYASPSIMRLLGIEPHELIGKSHLSLVLLEDRQLLGRVAGCQLAGQKEAFASFRMVKKDGSIIWVEGAGRLVVDGPTGSPEFVITVRDITERKNLENKLAALAHTDGLTGLANRRAFDDALDSQWRRTVREGTMMSLLMLDVDSFKAFNDHYGHQTGDDCLRAVGYAIAQTISRPADLPARYGGEEFAVLLPNTDAAGALTVARAMLASIDALAIPHDKTMAERKFITVSVGCATALPRAGVSAQMPAGLIAAADKALYKAKAAGRDRIETGLVLAQLSP